MFKVSLCLVIPADAIILGIGTTSQYSQLWKDKPYPVSTFAPICNFPQGILVVVLMCSQESFKIVTTIAIKRNVFHELLRKDDILHINGIRKEWSNLNIMKSCNTAAYACNEERKSIILFGKANELIHIGLDGFHPTLHGRDGVCLTMQTHAFAPYGTKLVLSQACSTATMCTCQIAAKHKYLVLLQFRNPIGGVCSVVHKFLL